MARVARGLRALGLGHGDRVLDLQPNSTTYLETDLAIRSAGLVRVALNHRLHPDDWARIADDSGAELLDLRRALRRADRGVALGVGGAARGGRR